MSPRGPWAGGSWSEDAGPQNCSNSWDGGSTSERSCLHPDGVKPKGMVGPKSRFYENGAIGEHRRGLNLEEALDPNRRWNDPIVGLRLLQVGKSQRLGGFSDFHFWGPRSGPRGRGWATFGGQLPFLRRCTCPGVPSSDKFFKNFCYWHKFFNL